MTIVFGAGKEAETYIREFSGTDEIVCYDNDRRKWGKTISGIPIITLEKYLETLRASKCKIIDTISNKTALYFLKDTCGEMHEVYCLHNKELKQLNLNDLRDYERELEAVESEKIKKYKAIVANKQGKSAFFAGSPVLTTKNQIEQRKKMAQKSALKLVKDAWDNDQAVEKTVASQRQRYAELDAQRTEAKKALAGYEDQEKTLKEQCNVADDSKEQQDLNLLEKRQEYRRGVGEKLTRDEWKKLNEIDKQPLTEYQKRALEIHAQAVEEKVTIRDTTSGMQAAVGNVKRIMIEMWTVQRKNSRDMRHRI